MRFDDWMITTGESNAAFGRKLEPAVSGEAIRRYRVREREPDSKAMAQIFDLSGGLVTPNDWVGVGPRTENATSEQAPS
jgi:hypothetical protein